MLNLLKTIKTPSAANVNPHRVFAEKLEPCMLAAVQKNAMEAFIRLVAEGLVVTFWFSCHYPGTMQLD